MNRLKNRNNPVIDTFGPKADEDIPSVVSFSGGRTSGYMLRRLLDKGLQPIVLFANTGKERDETLEFVHEVESRWTKVIWLEYCRVPTNPAIIDLLKTERMKAYCRKNEQMHWFKEVDYKSAARHSDAWGPFDELLNWMSVLPNSRVRSCTAQLKIRTMQRYLWSQGIYRFFNYIGFRADEWDRAYAIIRTKERDFGVGYKFELAENNIKEQDVLDWWKDKSYNLKLEPHEGNCHLCFLKKRKNKLRLIKDHPELTAWWQSWEDKKKEAGVGESGSRWRIEKGHAIVDLISQASLLEDEAEDDLSIDCSCSSGMALGTEIEE